VRELVGAIQVGGTRRPPWGGDDFRAWVFDAALCFTIGSHTAVRSRRAGLPGATGIAGRHASHCGGLACEGTQRLLAVPGTAEGPAPLGPLIAADASKVELPRQATECAAGGIGHGNRARSAGSAASTHAISAVKAVFRSQRAEPPRAPGRLASGCRGLAREVARVFNGLLAGPGTAGAPAPLRTRIATDPSKVGLIRGAADRTIASRIGYGNRARRAGAASCSGSASNRALRAADAGFPLAPLARGALCSVNGIPCTV
jgi:hypothetical protein